MNGLALKQALSVGSDTKTIKVQVGKRVYEVMGVLPTDPAAPSDAYLSVNKLARTPNTKEENPVEIALTVKINVLKVTKKEKEKLLAAGIEDTPEALARAKAEQFLKRAKMRGCAILSIE